MSSSVRLSASRPGKRARYSALNSSISCAAIFLKSSLMLSPDSNCSLSTRMVFGRASHLPSRIIAENIELRRARDFRPSASLLLPSGHVVEDQLGDVGVVADDDKDRGSQAACRGLGILLASAGRIFHSWYRGYGWPLVIRRAVSARRTPPPFSGLFSASPREYDSTGHGRSAERLAWNRPPPGHGEPSQCRIQSHQSAKSPTRPTGTASLPASRSLSGKMAWRRGRRSP